MITLKWPAGHWNRGRRGLCHICGTKSYLVDDVDRPAHKVCVEDFLTWIEWDRAVS